MKWNLDHILKTFIEKHSQKTKVFVGSTKFNALILSIFESLLIRKFDH